MNLAIKRYTIFLLFLLVYGCKKEEEPLLPKEPEEIVEEKDEEEDLIKISTFYYTKQLSLWSESLPPGEGQSISDAGVIRAYTDRFETGEEVLEYLKSLTPLYNGRPKDRFSFIDRVGEVSAEIDEAKVNRLGFSVGFYDMSLSDKEPELFVKMVDKGSPADMVGLKRGMKITAINGKTSLSAKDKVSISFIRSALKARDIEVRYEDQGGNVSQKQIRASAYSYDPMLGDAIFEVDNKKVGYLAFSAFVGLRIAGNYTDMYTTFENLFSEFENQQISSLIVDLRYNGGGSVTTTEYLANKLVPVAGDRQLMYDHQVNSYIESLGWKEEGRLFGPVKYKKDGILNLSTIYFLVSNGTASASELLINVLKPYTDVQVIGTYVINEDGQEVAASTYGKPVGFFGWPIKGRQIELYATSFQTFNADGEGDYFDGLEANVFIHEGVRSALGDQQEGMIAAALMHAKTQTYPRGQKVGRKYQRGTDTLSSSRRNDPLIQIGNIEGMFKFADGKEMLP